MESNLPPEIILKILKKSGQKNVSNYMQASKSAYQSGQEYFKYQALKLMKTLPSKESKEIDAILDSTQSWMEVYRKLRRLKLFSQIQQHVKRQNLASVDLKVESLLKIVDLMDQNRDLWPEVQFIVLKVKELLLDGYKNLNELDLMWKLQVAYAKLFPETYEEDFKDINVFE
jgi:hypothetical protein